MFYNDSFTKQNKIFCWTCWLGLQHYFKVKYLTKIYLIIQ